MAAVKLEKISDNHMYLFIEIGLRGGVSYIAKRHAKENNKYMRDYDPKKPSTFINYLDMNNLYGWATSEYLPYGRLEWLKNIDKFDVISISDKSEAGYILEVELKYSGELRHLHNDSSISSRETCCF